MCLYFSMVYSITEEPLDSSSVIEFRRLKHHKHFTAVLPEVISDSVSDASPGPISEIELFSKYLDHRLCRVSSPSKRLNLQIKGYAAELLKLTPDLYHYLRKDSEDYDFSVFFTRMHHLFLRCTFSRVSIRAPSASDDYDLLIEAGIPCMKHHAASKWMLQHLNILFSLNKRDLICYYPYSLLKKANAIEGISEFEMSRYRELEETMNLIFGSTLDYTLTSHSTLIKSAWEDIMEWMLSRKWICIMNSKQMSSLISANSLFEPHNAEFGALETILSLQRKFLGQCGIYLSNYLDLNLSSRPLCDPNTGRKYTKDEIYEKLKILFSEKLNIIFKAFVMKHCAFAPKL
jgi:hypothetical protein